MLLPRLVLPSRKTLAEGLPLDRLRRLEHLLARGNPVDSPSAPTLSSSPLGAIIRQLRHGDAGEGWWACLSPVTLQAGTGGVGLIGMVAPSTAELGALADLAGPALDRLDWSVRIGDEALLWVHGNAEPDLETCLPDDALGRDVEPFLPRGADASRWRSACGELEIELHHAEFNRRRLQDGLAPLNGVWLWGSGTLPGDTEAEDGTWYCDHPARRWLAEWQGLRCEPVPPPDEFAAGEGTCVVFLDRAVDAGRLDAWLAALVSGDLGAVTVQFGAEGPALELRPWHRLRIWRRGLGDA